MFLLDSWGQSPRPLLRGPFELSGITTDFNGASVDFPFADLLARAGDPS
jgi:hypothetical protein